MIFIMEPLKIIKHALASSIELINKGENPTNALEKVARELDLNPNYIQRTGEALNVALTYDHFKKNASDKAADFDIADTQAATKNIFGEREKTLVEKKAEWFPAVAEDLDYNKLLTNPKFKKTASEIAKTDAKNDSFPISYKGQFKKAQDYLSRMDRDMDELLTKKAGIDTYIEASFFNLVKHFTKEAAARTAFNEFESQVYAEHGERAVPYIDAIYKHSNVKDERGTHDAGYLAYTPCYETQLFDSFLKAASDKLAIEKEIKESEAIVAEEKSRFKQATYQLNPIAKAMDKAACDKLANDFDFYSEDIEKLAMDKTAFGELGKSMVQELFSKFHDSATGKDQSKPVFKNTNIDNRERIAILQELIMTDPILMKQDPRKIIQAYQQILRLAPQISKEKEVVRAKLREMMAGQALHPTDANQLVEANTNLMKQHQMLHQTEGGSGKDKK